MATKSSRWMMAVGAFIAFIGLCFLPAAFGQDADRTMLGGGSVIVSTGLLLISAGFYLKARTLAASGIPPTAQANTKKNRKPICDRCAVEEPVIQCRVHQLHLCAECLNKHYDFRSCAYVPSTRRVAASRANAAAAGQTASS
ncbi:MAG TPA: hypothetical protein VEU94_04225 [Terriglobales bacterium]|jgi:hypothetical protein|nr:hypothetical protein [Terriglobales bacterium]